MSPITVLHISDGRSGHSTLAEGLIAAMARRRSVVVVRREVRRPRWLPARAISYVWNAGLGPERLLSTVYGIEPAALPRADVVVSAGGDTLGANVAAARLLAAPNVFYGSLRRFPPEDFALVLTSYARNADRPRHVMSLKPSRFDVDGLPRPNRRPGAPPVAGLLVGGDAGRQVRFTRSDWDRLVAFLEAMHAADGTRWLVTNSRRTPDAVADRLAALASGAGAVARFIDVRRPGSGTLEELFAACEVLAVTADSSSMVSEGVWVGRPVVALEPAACSLDANEAGYRDWLARSGWVRSLAIARLDPAAFQASLAQIRPLAVNPLDQLAELLAQRLPQLLAGR